MLHRLRKRILLWAIAAPLAVAGQPVLASTTEPVSASVAYADLDLTRARGVAVLERRIGRAVEQICGRGLRPVAEMLEQRRCAAEAHAQAKPQVERVIAQARRQTAPTFLASAAP